MKKILLLLFLVLVFAGCDLLKSGQESGSGVSPTNQPGVRVPSVSPSEETGKAEPTLGVSNEPEILEKELNETEEDTSADDLELENLLKSF